MTDNPIAAPTVTATLTTAFAETYVRYADRVAVVGEDGSTLTYADLGVRARGLAGGLSSLGMRPGDRAVIVMQNRPECFVIDHALAAGGFVRAALSYRLHGREIADVARDCGATVVFVDADREGDISRALGEAGLDTRIIAVDEPQMDRTLRFADLVGHTPSESPSCLPEDLAWLPYTSGTTGEPKGVMLTHRSVLACARNLMVELDAIQSDDVVLHVAPLTHLSGYLSVPYTLRGATHVCASKFAPDTALRAIAEHGVTVLPAVPTMLNMMLPELETGSWATETLHTVLYGGSPIAPERLRRLVTCLGDVFVQGYGLTEVPFPLSALSKHDHRFDPAGPVPERLGSAGRVNPFVEVRLVGDDGRPVAEGEEGEIQARGDTTMAGYWNKPAATAAVLHADGWATTGDVGRLQDGFLYVVDRKKDMIVSGGFNVFPAEIEAAISALPGVGEVAVIGIPDQRWGEAVKAIIVVRDGHEVTSADVDRVCLERIASYKRPRVVEFVEELPKTGTGKIQRHVLRERDWAGQSRRVGG